MPHVPGRNSLQDFAAVFAAVAITAHLGYAFELLLAAAGRGDGAWAWLAVLAAQLLACAGCGALLARLHRAGLYITVSFAAIGLFYFAAPFHQFAYICSGLWYGLPACLAGLAAARSAAAIPPES